MKELELRRVVQDDNTRTAQVERALRPTPLRFTFPTGGAAAAADMYDVSTPTGAGGLPTEMYGDAIDYYVLELEEELDKRDRVIEAKQRAVREEAQKRLQQHSAFLGLSPTTMYDFLLTPDRPSAPPPVESTYTTPLAPRTLAEEFKSLEENDSAKKIQAAFRKKKAEEAKAKAIKKKEEEHQNTLTELSRPFQSTASSSSTTTPFGVNPVEIPATSKVELNDNTDKGYWLNKNRPLKIIKEQLNARGVQVSGTGLVKEDYVNLLIKQIKIDNKIKQNSALGKAFKGMKTKK